MKSDSLTTRRQKERITHNLEYVYGLKLPRWLTEGTTVADLRSLEKLVEGAWERYKADDASASTPDGGSNPDR